MATFADDAPALPKALAGKAVVVAPTDPAYPKADIGEAVKNPGLGGISQGIVVKLTKDVPIYRMYNGPTKVDSQGHTNRVGQWWSYDAPNGSQQSYRSAYEICQGWNDLTWVATCTLKKGAVVAIGPGQSVWAETCGDATGTESYAADPGAWQVWISKAWTRNGKGKDLDCPADTKDYAVEPTDLSKHKAAKP